MSHFVLLPVTEVKKTAAVPDAVRLKEFEFEANEYDMEERGAQERRGEEMMEGKQKNQY